MVGFVLTPIYELMVTLKDLVAISTGSACTSTSYTPSHVLKVMGMDDDQANACVRISWRHLTPEVDWEAVADRIRTLHLAVRLGRYFTASGEKCSNGSSTLQESDRYVLLW